MRQANFDLSQTKMITMWEMETERVNHIRRLNTIYYNQTPPSSNTRSHSSFGYLCSYLFNHVIQRETNYWIAVYQWEI